MGTISVLIFIASIICFFVGLISPQVFKKWFGQNINRKRIALIFGGLIVASSIMTNAYAEPSNNKPKENTAQEVKTPEVQSPKIEAKDETKTEEIVFQIENKNDSTLDKGQTKVSQEGKNGTKELKFKVTYTDGKETAREKISENITVQPVNKIVLNGTKEKVAAKPAPVPTPAPESKCDPNYSGACVPIASDVDCAGGSGNGPAYVRGPVNVIGRDIYDLDRDGNGIGCEN